MKLARRQFLHLAAGAAVLPACASAQAYPSRPVKIIVGQAAGSASDIVARLIAQFLSEKLGQQFFVEVRPGAAGNIATEAVTHMPPDGYTLLLINSQNAINVALYDKLSFDFVRDITPVGRYADLAAADQGWKTPAAAAGCVDNRAASISAGSADDRQFPQGL